MMFALVHRFVEIGIFFMYRSFSHEYSSYHRASILSPDVGVNKMIFVVSAYIGSRRLKSAIFED